MKKRIALIAMLLAAVMMLSGCNLIGYDAELDGAQVVAKVNDTELTKADWLTYRDYLASYYQEYYQQYFGFAMPMDEETVASYGESALEQMIESAVLEDKMEELGLSPLSEEEVAEVESYADEMVDLYKMIVRFQNYPDLETVEEEQERLAAEAAEAAETAETTETAEATETAEPAEPVATVTNAQLDEMLLNDLNIIGYNRDYFVQTQTASVLNDKIYAHATEGVEVTDEQVKTEFDEQVAAQKESYDANPAAYASAVNAGSEPYYVPAGYRGVKNLLVMISDEKQAEIDELKTALTTAQNALDSANADLEEMKAEDTSALDEEGLAAYNEQIAALEEQAALSQATVDETQPKIDALTEEAFAEILPQAEEALAKAVAGEDFDALVEAYGDDTGMAAEPNKTRGYLVCDGLAIYEQNFQDAAMALGSVGDVSAELVKTSYGYHILQYATDVASGEVEYTDEIKEELRATMLTEAQDAAYTAAVTQWVSEAKVETFPKVME
ncbi:MAG: SurA N-terminal domain-containing protein [Clostridia bacterium]|nr:SurA N-terminal domain-containing protein [Clostridia bacterium]MBQ6858484.1 SurA N-terminal domain-containing protein [Clostridia bacterium]MBQ7052259.1 SurA N-terminal domain-containing protein [Clostridia bacterium]